MSLQPPPGPPPGTDAGEKFSDDVLAEALAFMQHMRQEEAKVSRAAAKRLTDPRHDSQRVMLEAMQQVQALRAETVKQIVRLERADAVRRADARRLEEENARIAAEQADHFVGVETRGEGFPLPPKDRPPGLYCDVCGRRYEDTEKSEGDTCLHEYPSADPSQAAAACPGTVRWRGVIEPAQPPPAPMCSECGFEPEAGRAQVGQTCPSCGRGTIQLPTSN